MLKVNGSYPDSTIKGRPRTGTRKKPAPVEWKPRELPPEDREQRLLRDRTKQYGWTAEQYTEAYQLQDGNCAICGEHRAMLFIDHCHDTQQVRRLLCRQCNLGLGLFKDNTDRLLSAVAYLS